MTVQSPMKIHYISYGITKTGGYRHEKFFFDEIVRYYGKGLEVQGLLFRKNKLFYNIFGYLELLTWSFFKSNANINIVTARTGISAMLRNWFTKNEVWIVMHNFDPNDNKSGLLKWYYNRLFSILKHIGHDRFKVIAVAPFFVKYFKEKCGIINAFLFPNLFDADFYGTFITKKKNTWVHLGQYSSKNDPEIVSLAKRLSESGYYCYFSTLEPSEVKQHNGIFEIIFFSGFSDYLNHMSMCCCTLALTIINEGWPRLAHESILVGTPVIGYANGGLSDLLKESNSIIVKNIEEAYICINEALWILPEKSFIEKYNIRNAGKYLDSICKHL